MCKRLFSSVDYVVKKMHSSLDPNYSLEPNTVNMIVCLRNWLSDDIWVRKRLQRAIHCL